MNPFDTVTLGYSMNLLSYFEARNNHEQKQITFKRRITAILIRDVYDCYT